MHGEPAIFVYVCVLFSFRRGAMHELSHVAEAWGTLMTWTISAGSPTTYKFRGYELSD